MVVFPKAKINLGLNVISKREDGFHAIQSVMMPIDLCDILEVLPIEGKPSGSLDFKTTGVIIPENGGQNLCEQAHALFLEKRKVPALQAHLHKIIPIGAGLGGGSSNAASMLQLLNKVVMDPLGSHELHEIAATLGSDVPLFLKNGACLAAGRGEELQELGVLPSLQGCSIVLVNPGIHISTGQAYSGTKLSGKECDFEAVVNQDLEHWRNGLFNSMESYAFQAHPVIADIKRSLYSAGAKFALMSGSGSTVYGVFSGPVPKLTWPSEWLFHTVQAG